MPEKDPQRRRNGVLLKSRASRRSYPSQTHLKPATTSCTEMSSSSKSLAATTCAHAAWAAGFKTLFAYQAAGMMARRAPTPE